MFSGKDLIQRGIKPNRISILLKQIQNISNEEAEKLIQNTLEDQNKVREKVTITSGSVLDWLLNDGKKFVPPFLEQRQNEPSNSEIRRALENKAVIINGFAPGPNASMDNQFPIWQLIWFPNGNKRCTMCDNPKPIDANSWFDIDGNIL